MLEVGASVQRAVPVPPVVGALGVPLVVDVVIRHQQVFSRQLISVVVCHVGADSKTGREKQNGSLMMQLQQDDASPAFWTEEDAGVKVKPGSDPSGADN